MGGGRLTDEQRLDWLRLIRSENVGPRTFRALLNQYGGASGALEALPGLARKAGRPALKLASPGDARRELDAAARLGARFVALGEPDYPKPLQAIDSAPPLICVRGDPAALNRPCVALVGSRNASAAGLTVTTRLVAGLGERGYVVVSGLARGIDTAAHKAALPTGTVAVLAGGPDRIYPPQNEGLLQRILAEGGAALSEMPFGWEPRARDFPRRNRIVSGLSLGVVVVEAARRSGSLITARFALEQGREVFAVPGSPLDPRAEGTNDLIREGATLCAAAEHVAAALDPLLDREFEPPRAEESGEPRGEREPLWEELDFLALDEPIRPAPAEAPARDLLVPYAFEEPAAAAPLEPRRVLLDLLGPTPVHVDDLARQAGLPVRAVQLALLDLELAGELERHGGNAVSRAPAPAR